jgi:amidase
VTANPENTPRPRRLDRTHTTLFFDPDASPVMEVADGERIVIETADSVCGIAKERAPHGFHIDAIVDELGGACPVTGPIAVQGATAGACLDVEIHRVDAHPVPGDAWTAVFQGFGALAREDASLQEPLTPETWIVPYDENAAYLHLDGTRVTVDLHPFLGTVGVAPRWERRLTFSQSPEYLGDVDLPHLTAGATLTLPINVDGALVGFGDAHAAQGDGEITGAAIEIEAEVEVTLSVRTREEAGYISLPQLNTPTTVGSIAAFSGVPLDECARIAYTDLVRRLVRFDGLRTNEAYALLGQVGQLRIGNMIDPFFSVLASIERQYLP